MATKKISELEAITEAEDDDVLVIVDTSEETTKKIEKKYFLSELSGTIEELQEDLEEEKENDLTAPASGESIDLSDSAKAKIREPKLIGKSWQNNISYIDVGTWEQGTINGTSGDNETSSSTVRTADYIPVVPNVLYNMVRTVATSYNFYRFYDANKTYLGTQASSAGIVTTDQPENRMGANVSEMTMTIVNTSVAYMRIADVSNDTSTKYTISTNATPSPDYKQYIHRTGDNVNEFDISQIPSGSVITNNGDGTLTLANNSNNNGYISTLIKFKDLCPNVKVGDTIVVNFNTTSQVAYKDRIYISTANIPIYKNIPIVVTQDILDNNVAFYGGYNETAIISEIKLEKGIVPTPWSPYGCGSINEKIQNKNFAKLNEEIKTISGIDLKDRGVDYTVTDTIEFDGTVTGSAALTLLLSTINLLPDTYRLTVDVISGSISTAITISLRDENNDPIDNVNISNIGSAKTITTTKKIKYIGTYLAVGKVFDKYKIRIQLEKGSTSTEFQPHAEQNISFPLEQGQIVTQNDYIDDDGIHHVRKQAVISIERIITLNANGNKAGIVSLSDKKFFTTKTILCTNCTYSQTGYTPNTFYENPGNIVMVGTTEDTLETLREKYDGGIIEYDLAEEVVEPFTEEQAEAWKLIKKIKTYKTVTHISSPDETPATMDMVYVKDLQTVIGSLTNAIISLGGNV